MKIHWIRWAIWAAVLILINSVASTLFFRIDLTGNKIHTLSDASTNVVSGLEEPLTIKIYLSANLPTPYNNLQQELSDLMESYALKANKFFNYSINIIAEGANDDEQSQAYRSAAQSYNLRPVQIQKVEADKVNLVSVYMGIVFIHGDMIETIPVLNSTDNKEVAITSTIQKMSDKTGALLALENDVKIKLYLSSSLIKSSPSLANYANSVKDAIEELNRQYYGRLAFNIIDPDSPVAGDRPPDEYSIDSLNLASGKVYAGLIVESSSAYRRIRLLKRNIFGQYNIEDPANIVEVLPGVVDTLVGINPKIGYLTDNGTIELYGNQQDTNTPGLGNFRTLINKNYDIEEISLEEGIPDEISTLLVAGPTERFSDWELFQLDQYILGGNSVAFFIDSMKEVRNQGGNQFYGQPPSYLPQNTGLDPLLTHYGLSVEQSYILDENSYVQTSRNQSGGFTETQFYFAPFIESDYINLNSVVMGNIKKLILLNTSPLTINTESPAGTVPEILFSSTDSSWEMRDNINLYDPNSIHPPAEAERKSLPAAALVSGPLNSYFQGKTLPAQPKPEEPAEDSDPDDKLAFSSDEVNAAFLNSGTGKVFVLGTSAILKDNILDTSDTNTNAAFLMNLVDVLGDRGDYARMRSKGQTYSPLKESSTGMKRFVKSFNMVGLPILVIFAGLLVWLRGLSRRRSIENLFRKDGE